MKMLFFKLFSSIWVYCTQIAPPARVYLIFCFFFPPWPSSHIPTLTAAWEWERREKYCSGSPHPSPIRPGVWNTGQAPPTMRPILYVRPLARVFITSESAQSLIHGPITLIKMCWLHLGACCLGLALFHQPFLSRSPISQPLRYSVPNTIPKNRFCL